jgi:hypothetical protein
VLKISLSTDDKISACALSVPLVRGALRHPDEGR